MHYQKFEPDAALLPFIECYFVWRGQSEEELDVQSPPNGFGAIVFQLGNPYHAYQGKQTPHAVSKAFVSGQFTSNYHLIIKGDIDVIGIVFKPSGLHNFFGMRMSQLVNHRMPLELLLPAQAGSFWSALKTERKVKGRIKLLEEFAMSLLPAAKARLSIIDEAVEFIDHHKGRITVEAVALHFKISRRYVEKHFLEKVGVSPKFYARIKRFNTLSKKVAYSKKFDWQDLVFENGLHDQSHLIKEFMEFNQMNPTEYCSKHTELIRFVKR